MKKKGGEKNGRKISAAEFRELQERIEIFELIFESIYNGSMVTDAEGYITHFNHPYGEFLGLDPAEQIGRHCTQVIENTRMHLVAQTGLPEINHSHRIKDQDMVVQRIPIKKDGRVIAVFGQVMFKDVRDVRALAEKLSLLESKVEMYERDLISLRNTRYTFESIFSHNPLMSALKEEARRAASTHLPVLITGESGTGKEVFAQAIHNAGPRRAKPFVRINCAVIPRDLLESELFGYERGAFTGAKSEGKPGKFELAHGGTVFLDEIGDLPLEMQPKMLRVLEEKEFERVGGNKLIRADFRVISATNQKLENMMRDGRFRRDLFYRLGVIPLNLPPLRERPDDIVPLALHLLEGLTENTHFSGVSIGPRAQDSLRRYTWPGNVRELINVLERILAHLEKNVIHLDDLPFHLRPSAGSRPSSSTGTPLKSLKALNEKENILRALGQAGHNKTEAARLLGIHRTLLYKKMKKYEIPL